MSRPIIEASKLSKVYRLGEIGAASLRDEASNLWSRLRGQTVASPAREFWALRDVSFSIQPGEVIGVIGRNGAGKSTLLKVLSRITEPTSGRAVLRGRVGSLLEVGTGFHPDLSGRDNIYLNGAILGMTRAEIRGKFDEIVAFAEVEKFLDTPVKRYSSGMYVRLAFAVAAHLEPEILIVDEVLAVGDAQFQKKCLGKMGEVAHRHGRTILFVSHNMVAVQSLCQRVLLMQGGTVAADCDSATGVARYLRDSEQVEDQRSWSDLTQAPGNELVRITRVSVSPDIAKPDENSLLTMQAGFHVVTEFQVLSSARPFHLTYHLLNDQGLVVFTTGCPSSARAPGSYRARFRVPPHLLNSGSYSLKLLIVENGNQVTFSREGLASFTIVDGAERTHGWLGREPGVVQPIISWETEKVAAS
ncbi:MAG: ABC transporter ATP-binding protein [Verrucomicrobiota bacterium]